MWWGRKDIHPQVAALSFLKGAIFRQTEDEPQLSFPLINCNENT